MNSRKQAPVEWPTETRPAWRKRETTNPNADLASQLGDDAPTLGGRITIQFLEQQEAAAEEACEICEQTEMCLLHE